MSEDVISAKSGKELAEKLRRLREDGDPRYIKLVEKINKGRGRPRKQGKVKEVQLSYADDLREPGTPVYAHGESGTENLDYHLEMVNCPRCNVRGGLTAHFGKHVSQSRWYGPYFGVKHTSEIPVRFCYFGKFYPDVIHTRVPDPNKEPIT